MENYLPKWGLQILIKIVLDRMYLRPFGHKTNLVTLRKCVIDICCNIIKLI